MARATTRSQASSQTQTRSQTGRTRKLNRSQSQRGQRARVVFGDEEEEEDDDDEGGGGGGDGDGDGEADDGDGDGDDARMNVDEEGVGDAEINRKANQLVRLALFNEHKRMPLRRDEISKKVLGNSRAFPRVFERAQSILKNTFGMELVELQSRAALEKELNGAGGDDEELDEAKKAIGLKKKSTAAGSKTYILRSTLDPTIIELASLTDDKILSVELKDAYPDSDDEDSDEDLKPRCTGSILSWTASDHPVPVGILYVILSLILISGRVISDSDLRSHLRRLHLPPQSTIPFSPTTTQRTTTIESYLGMLQRQGYIDRAVVGDANVKRKGKGKSSGGRGKRGRVSMSQGGGDEEGGVKYEWRWGIRAQSEVGERGVARFVAEFMVGAEEEEGGNERGSGGGGREGRSRDASGLRNKLEKMEMGIEKAAGGNLSELK